MNKMTVTIVTAISLSVALSATGVADSRYWEDDTASWPDEEKTETRMINGNAYAPDAIPPELESRLVDSTGDTGIRVYENGGTLASFGGDIWFDGGIESVGRNGVVAASNERSGIGVLGLKYLAGGSAVAGYSRPGNNGGSGNGVYGESNSSSGYGIYAVNTSPKDNNNTIDGPDGPKGVALYARGATDIYYGSSPQEGVNEHVAVIENSSTTDAAILALYASGIQSDTLDPFTNFITFVTRNTTDSADENVGAIEGSVGGVTLNTSSGDFAEWLAMRDPKEQIEASDIVGVSGGSISKNLDNADHFQVISTSPAVSGNSPKGDRKDYRRVAFIGQVPVKVRGTVQIGDYILPSGKNDGTGIARAANALGIADLSRVVGRAWSASQQPGIKAINVVVGLDTTAAASQTLRQQGQRIVALEQQLAEKTARLEQLAARVEHFDQRLAAIAAANWVAVKP